MRKQKKQGGFTLVEIAIVMVIIGLLLGGALKGQEMIQNAKTKRIKADFDQYVAAFYSYQDIYQSLPGDNKKANEQHGGVNPTAAKAGDGVINSKWDSKTDGNESRLYWEHLRTAGLISGAGQDQPKNAFAGQVGIENAVAGFKGPGLCFGNVTSNIAAIIDNQYDDGVGTTGTIRGVVSAETAVAYTDAGFADVICLEM